MRRRETRPMTPTFDAEIVESADESQRRAPTRPADVARECARPTRAARRPRRTAA
jgi:hypothetical protein